MQLPPLDPLLHSPHGWIRSSHSSEAHDQPGQTARALRQQRAVAHELSRPRLIVNNINQQSGLSENNVFFEDFLNVLRSAGADSQNQNTLFDSNFYSFLPPINIDKFVNYQEYFWSTEGPKTISVNGTLTTPINVLKDIIGKKSYTSPNGIELKNGAIVEFIGEHVIPESYMGARYIVEGVGESIILYEKEPVSYTHLTLPTTPYV